MCTVIIDRGTTTTPFDMVVLNEMSRFHLAMDALKHIPRLRLQSENAINFFNRNYIASRLYPRAPGGHAGDQKLAVDEGLQRCHRPGSAGQGTSAEGHVHRQLSGVRLKSRAEAAIAQGLRWRPLLPELRHAGGILSGSKTHLIGLRLM